MRAKKKGGARRSKVRTANDVNVSGVLQAAIKGGLIKGDTTISQVAGIAASSNIGTLGYAVAWDRYVAVVA